MKKSNPFFCRAKDIPKLSHREKACAYCAEAAVFASALTALLVGIGQARKQCNATSSAKLKRKLAKAADLLNSTSMRWCCAQEELACFIASEKTKEASHAEI